MFSILSIEIQHLENDRVSNNFAICVCGLYSPMYKYCAL